MAICDACDQDMTTGAGCTVAALHLAGRPFPVPRHRRRRGGAPDEGCGDCGVRPGGLHHVGCDLQRCPRCRHQLVTCGCRWDELGEVRFDDDDDLLDDEPSGATASAPVVSITSSRPEPAARVLVPFGAAVAPLRARHQDALRGVAAWCLAEGRTCDLDVAALCIEALEPCQSPEGHRLARPTVNGVLWAAGPNLSSSLRTLLPDAWPVHLWSVLCWLQSAGRLHVDGDPFPALLEPLRCYGRLGPDGYPMPSGVEVDFPCQCFLPHDPTCPPGLAQRIVGRDPETLDHLVARGRLRAPNEDPTLASYRALITLARRLRAERSAWEVHIDEFDYVGRLAGHRSTPELWLYHHRSARRRRVADDLVLDADGTPWVPRADRRRRIGFRWVQVSDVAGPVRAGFGWDED